MPSAFIFNGLLIDRGGFVVDKSIVSSLVAARFIAVIFDFCYWTDIWTGSASKVGLKSLRG